MTLPNPTLVCEFARTKRLPSALTFTRASTASYVDVNGYIQYVDNDEARFDHTPIDGTSNGLLIEESRTNKLTNSNNASTWTMGNLTISTNSEIAPDGTLSADKLVENTTASVAHWIQPTCATGVTSGQAYTWSVYVKAAGRTKCIMGFDTATFGGSGFYGLFDLAAGTASNYSGTPTLSITPYPNGWYRISVTATCTVTGTSYGSIQTYTTSNSYTGDGVSGVYVWGAQLEQASFATSYIPSTETFTSRASTATYFDSTDGVMKTTPTNLITYSQDFTNAAWTKTNLLAFSSTGSLSNIAIAPDGTQTASKLVENTANGSHDVAQSFSATAGQSYTCSVYLRAGERSKATLIFGNGASWASADIDITNKANLGQYYSGMSNSVVTITDEGFGWVRVSLHSTAVNTTSTTFNIRLYGSASTYTGDGVSGLYVWGAQVNVGAVNTYIPTTTTTVSSGSGRTFYNAYSGKNLGLLSEPAATNLVTYSQAADNAYWTKVNCTATANQTFAPNGSYTADLMTINTTSSVEHYHEVILTIGTNQTSTASWFVKAGTQRYIRISSYSSPTTGNNGWVLFDLFAGTVVGSGQANATQQYGIIPYPNGWFRIWQTITFASSSDTQRYVRLHFSNNAAATSYVGAVTDNYYVWGAQLEIGGLTSYIPTFGVTTTRSADVSSSTATTRQADNCYINRSNWFNQLEGTIYTISKMDNIASGTFPRIFQIQGLNNATDRMTTYYSTNNTTVATTVMANNVTTQLASATVTGGSPVSIVFGYKTNDAAASINGAAVATDNTVELISNPTRLTIGNNANVQNYLNGTINRLYYWTKRLPNTDIENISGLDF